MAVISWLHEDVAVGQRLRVITPQLHLVIEYASQIHINDFRRPELVVPYMFKCEESPSVPRRCQN